MDRKLSNDKFVSEIEEILKDKKGERVLAYDVGDMTSFTKFIVIASFNSDTQIKSVIKEINSKFKAPEHVEGRPDSGWVLLDYENIIVNLFLKEQREFYNLERIWGEAERIT
ncbi:MAG: ribosome silencing factor [Elusimicrobiota bacterium]